MYIVRHVPRAVWNPGVERSPINKKESLTPSEEGTVRLSLEHYQACIHSELL